MPTPNEMREAVATIAATPMHMPMETWQSVSGVLLLGASELENAMSARRDDDQLIEERDTAQEWADELANLISAITGVDIGEHSNLNNPWERAAMAAKAFLATKKE